MDIVLEQSWKKRLEREFEAPYFTRLRTFIRKEYLSRTIYPPPNKVFRALDLCPFEDVRVVILGQDPYHGTGQANGLAFAVHTEVAVPPSLRNIFKEIATDLAVSPQFENGDLTRWGTQGVLLLNAILTVRAHAAASHQGAGWEQFTDAIIETLVREHSGLVFMLWGRSARSKGAHIDRAKHLVLEAPHPSPLSAHNGFFGCKHFSAANTYLEEHGSTPIDWR